MLSCKQSSNGEQIAPNVFLQEGRVGDAGIISGTTPKGFRKPVEFGIKLFIDAAGLNFQPELNLFGSPKRNERGELSDWGGAFPVRDALIEVAGYDGPIGDDLKIPEAVMRAFLGKRVFYIRYCYGKDPQTGKGKYGHFNQVAGTREAAVDKWVKSRAKGYPKDYVADLDNAPEVGNGPVMQEAPLQF